MFGLAQIEGDGGERSEVRPLFHSAIPTDGELCIGLQDLVHLTGLRTNELLRKATLGSRLLKARRLQRRNRDGAYTARATPGTLPREALAAQLVANTPAKTMIPFATGDVDEGSIAY